jgi:hypothetical protein
LEVHAVNFKNSDDDLSLVNKSGRLLKRFNKFVKLATGHDIDSAMQGKIGDKLQYFVNQAKSFVIDFHDKIDWEDGMYGHSGSCWFPGGCYEESSEVFDANGGWSIRFYRDMQDTQGIGRTWVVPMDNGIVAFNCYGPSRADVSKIIKKVFAGHDVELHYKSVSVYNSQDENIPYVNSGTGFVLAESGHDFLNEEQIDLDWEVSGRGRYSCDHCGDRIHEDYTFSGANGDGTYCESCYNDLFSFCEKCDETFNNDDVYRVSGSRYDWLCEYCLERIGAVKCDDCGDWTVDDYHIMRDSENVYCESCVDRNTEFTCQCGERFEHAMDDGDTCESCDYVYCDKCNEMVSDRDDHDSETHSGDESETETGKQDESIVTTDDVVHFAEKHLSGFESFPVKLFNQGSKQEYTVKVWFFNDYPGLFVYDDSALNVAGGNGYRVIHTQSGLAAGGCIPNWKTAITYMEKLGPITNWMLPTDECLNDSVSDTARSIRLELGL